MSYRKSYLSARVIGSVFLSETIRWQSHLCHERYVDLRFVNCKNAVSPFASGAILLSSVICMKDNHILDNMQSS